MSDNRQELGRYGEQIAAQYLEKQGFKILERNWRCSRGELDLVAEAGKVLVFVEVKTRSGRSFGLPEEALNYHKRKKLLQLGQYYLLEHDIEDIEWRIDIVAIELDQSGKLLRCDHIPNAVWAW
ncbi:MAG: YraN family protein [Candidatus Promineifilaceae bacterium]|nr:YraN family protein [Candidatus Promineifilaceae bacterium]